MCGIAGVMNHGARGLSETLEDMARALEHRGPDSSGIWADDATTLGFAHTRLAIIDVSPSGNQPMVSASGRFVVTYNGEIYNYRDLRSQLEARGRTFRGTSDTEVILAAFEEWSVEKSLPLVNGMFAMGIYDRQQRVLYLTRDRVGKKPLYYGWAGDAFVFASELKAIRQHPAFMAEIEPLAVAEYLRLGYIPAPLCIYRDLRKLPPGSLVTVDVKQVRQWPAPQPYWSLAAVAEKGLADAETGRAPTLDELEAVLRDAVRLRMISDVPLGALLSGGIDSSLVVSLMQHESRDPIETFTIGFEESGWDEAPFARRVADHLGTAHTELYVTAAEAREVVPTLPVIYDEPFADSSQIPTYLVSRLARRRVTVALCGDGGDELFAGYARYQWGRHWMARAPRFARRAGARVARAIGALVSDSLLASANAALPSRLRQDRTRHKLNRLITALEASEGREGYGPLMELWPRDSTVAAEMRSTGSFDTTLLPHASDAEWMQLVDSVTYLPDDLLVKVDRASMAVGLEIRAPLLDYRVVELAWRFPIAWKIRDGVGKWPLRTLARRYLPDVIIDRPKTGFGVPVGEWLRGPLREWAESLLAEQKLAASGLVNPRPVRQRWLEHLQGVDRHGELWAVLMLQSWLESHAGASRQSPDVAERGLSPAPALTFIDDHSNAG